MLLSLRIILELHFKERKEILMHSTTWMNSEDILLSEIYEAIWGVQSSQILWKRELNGGCQGLGKREKWGIAF